MLSFTKEELEAILLSINNANSTNSQTLTALKDKVEYMIKDIEEQKEKKLRDSLLCSCCHGDGEYEVSAGSHSFFRACEFCGGTGKK